MTNCNYGKGGWFGGGSSWIIILLLLVCFCGNGNFLGGGKCC